MAWLNVEVSADRDTAEALADALLAQGALSVAIEDAAAGATAEEPKFDAPDRAAPLWTHCLLRALFAPATDIANTVAQATAALGMTDSPAYRVRRIGDKDWVRFSQSQFGPSKVSERLWVIPSWHTPPEANAVNLVLDPGLAFGTGTHPSTRLVLRWLDAYVRGGESVLDYGCGSGILSIAAAKLGAARVLGIDNDPIAVDVARRNAKANGIRAAFRLPDSTHEFAADMTLANILANSLKLLAPVLTAATRLNGQIVLSGILQNQAAEVAAAYTPACDMGIHAEEADWVCLVGTRRG